MYIGGKMKRRKRVLNGIVGLVVIALISVGIYNQDGI